MGSRDRVIAFRPRIGTKIRDPLSGGIYFLEKVIGTSDDHDYVYKASYYSQDYSSNGNSRPTKFVTVKYVKTGSENEVRRVTEMNQIESRNIIDMESWTFYGASRNGLVVTLPYMSEGSFRYLLSSRFHYGIPEDYIAIGLKEALLGLKDLHDSGRVHKSFNAAHIFVNYNSDRLVANIEIKLAIGNAMYDSDLDYNVHPKKQRAVQRENYGHGSSSVMPLSKISEWSAPPEVFYTDIDDEEMNNDEDGYTTKSDIWLVGITALELAYGNIRACDRQELEKIIKKIKKSKKLPVRLEDLLEKKGRMKTVMSFIKDKLKLGKRVFSSEFVRVVLKCLKDEESKRPTIDELLEFPFFKKAKDLKWFKRNVLHGKNPVPMGED